MPRQRRCQHARYALQTIAACQPSGSERNDKALAMTSSGSKARLVLASRAILGGVCSAVSYRWRFVTLVPQRWTAVRQRVK